MIFLVEPLIFVIDFVWFPFICRTWKRSSRSSRVRRWFMKTRSCNSWIRSLIFRRTSSERTRKRKNGREVAKSSNAKSKSTRRKCFLCHLIWMLERLMDKILVSHHRRISWITAIITITIIIFRLQRIMMNMIFNSNIPG